jgi:ubiquitin
MWTGKTIMLSVETSATIESVKSKIHAMEGISPDQQTLTIKGRQMRDGKSIF